MLKIENGELDQYGDEPFEQQQFGIASIEGVNARMSFPLLSVIARALISIINSNNREVVAAIMIMIGLHSTI